MAESQPPDIETVRAEVLAAYHSHSSVLSRMAMAMTRNRSLAQDILQETFLRYFLSRMHGDTVADERDWLCQVMRSLVADWRKANFLDTEVALDEAARAAAKETGRPSGQKELPWSGKAARILAPREQECILLRAQGLEYREIASAMRIDIGTVGTLLNRAVNKLKQFLRTGEKMA